MNAAHDTLRKEHSSPEIFSYTLKIGNWKKTFRAGYYKTLIAEALNCTVHKGEFRNTIVGYLISDRRLCLVLRTEHKKVRRMLNVFYGNLREEIAKSLEAMNKSEAALLPKSPGIEKQLQHLFTEYVLKNTQLIKLITGRKVRLPYTDPQLERLKASIRNYPFCSAIDYGGGESPVLVKVLRKKDWPVSGMHNDSKKHEHE